MRLIRSTLATCSFTILMVTAAAPVAARDSVETRLQRIESMLERQGLADLYLGLQELRQEVQRLRGEVEEQSHQIKGLKQRQRDLYLDIDRRLKRLEGGAASGQPPSGDVPGAATAGNPPPVVASGHGAVVPTAPVSDDEQTAYKTAFNYLKEGRYKQAVDGFRGFLKKFPDSGYSVNAQYWLGEAFYVNGNFKEAIVEFQKVLVTYPNNPKVADTLLKIGYCHYEMKDNKRARETFAELQRRFPGSTAARLADNRLQRMKLEGR
jgi:tol-pal system protein YbgF